MAAPIPREKSPTLQSSTSRIFVKNLPPNLREQDFKKHFSQLAQPTDIKFIPKRRIGYVGYKSAEEAGRAAKYFNKSFIRMSKIAVELARAVGEVQSRRKREHGRALGKEEGERRFEEGGDMEAKSAEWKKDKDGTEVKNPKLDEFLQTMAPPSKSRTWANEDTSYAGKPGPEAVPVVDSKGDGLSDEEYQIVSKKRKRSAEEEDEGYASKTKSPRMLSAKVVVREPTTIQKTESNDHLSGSTGDRKSDDEVDTKNEVVQTVTAPASDSDWLRSKTSRLLGLVDDEEFEESKELQPQNQEFSKTQRLERRAQQRVSPELSLSDAASQTEEEVQSNKILPGIQISPETNTKPDTTQLAEAESNGRLFIRNLAYSSIEPDLRNLFSGYGEIEEVHISRNTKSGTSKGFGYVQFENKESALQAMAKLDGKSFQGRLLHILPAAAKREYGLSEYEMSKLPLKKQQQIRRKAEASNSTFKWNSMYMNPNAIVSSIADRLGIAKSDLLDPTSTDAAVKQAHAETNVIQETKNYFSSQGVDLESFKKKDLSDRAILVKNFPYGTTAAEIKNTFEVFGTVTKVLMPPSATIAIVEMEQPTQARSAFKSLAYRKFKDSVLFLERAPKGVFEGQANLSVEITRPTEGKLSTSELLEQPDDTGSVLTSTLFVRNLNFSTTSEELRDLFNPLPGFLSARVKTKTNPKKPEEYLSMGFGFVEFRSKDEAQSAASALNGYKLAGHELTIKESQKALDAGTERRRENVAKKVAGRRTKIIIKNLPFEATKKDVRALFGPYGQLRSVRVPKKYDSSSRGFAFADFVTTREAENAMKSLHGVHLLGRRLNLDFAAEDLIDPEEEIEKMQKKVESQANKVAIQKLTSGGRKKFSVNQNDDQDVD